MYSPKIAEKHIPVVYKLAKDQRKPMTKLVNEIKLADIKAVLHRIEERAPESARRTYVCLNMIFRYCGLALLRPAVQLLTGRSSLNE